MSNYVYSFNNVVCVVGTFEIRGYGESADGISIVYDNPLITDISGTDGDTVTSLVVDYRATITLRLHNASPANAFLSGLLQTYRTGKIIPTPFLVRDSAGLDLHTAPHVSVVKHPDSTYAKESTLREWELRAPELISFNGGGQQLS